VIERDGFEVIPGFLAPDAVAEPRAEVHRFVQSVLPDLPNELVYYEDRTRPETLKQVQRMFEHDAYFQGLMSGSRFEALAAELLDEPAVGKNLQYFNKPAGHSQPTPPHQDGHYFMLQPCRALTMWLALEDVSREQGCMHYARGSHRLGLRDHAPAEVLGFSQHIPDFDADTCEAVACPARAGDLIVHDAQTIHWAGANRSASPSREALGFIYYGLSAQEDSAAQAEYQLLLAERLAAQGKI
jgi:phytanoyl-CoA hydroxylase